MSLEYLGEEPSRRLRFVGPLVLALVVAVGLGAWWAQNDRDHADQALATAAVEVQRDADAGQAKVLSTLAYASPMIWSSQVSEGVRANLRTVVQGSAAQVVSGLREIREHVASTRVLPWEKDQLADRKAVLAVVDAHIGRFARIATDARLIGDVMAQPSPVMPGLLRASGGESPSAR